MNFVFGMRHRLRSVDPPGVLGNKCAEKQVSQLGGNKLTFIGLNVFCRCASWSAPPHGRPLVDRGSLAFNSQEKISTGLPLKYTFPHDFKACTHRGNAGRA
jgi:hypothetical protein